MNARVKVAAQILAGRISGLTHDGLGVVTRDEGPVFVDGALPGEDVTYRISRKKRRYTVGELEEIVTKSPDRATPRCRHFGVCGGCRLQQLTPEAQLAVKGERLAESLKRLGRVEPESVLEPVSGEPWNYRRRARLSVRWVQKKGRAVVGFRERKGSFVTDASECPILCEPFASMLPALSELVTGLSIRARLPQIEVSAGDDVNALVFRVLDPLSADDECRLADFGSAHGVDIWLQPGAPATVTPLGDIRSLSYGLPAHDVTIGYGPLDFIQINATVNAKLVSRAVELLAPQPGEHVLDLFSGLGNFSLPLARCDGRVTGVEGDAVLVERARQNASDNGIDNVDFEVDDLFSDRAAGSWRRNSHTRMLLDPPRAGARQIVENIGDLNIARIVYVSCDPATLARDAGTLVNGHGYRLSAAGVVDMFPHTAHVESIAVFDRDL